MTKGLTYCPILNTNINVTDMEKTTRYLTEHLEEMRGSYICVSNVHTTVMAFRDEAYRAIQNGAAMALPDGKPLSMVSRRRGFREARRVPGPDLMPRMLQISQEKGYRHFFYGSKPETLEKLRKNLEKDFPGLQIAGMYSPPFRPLTPEEDQEIISMINEARPDFIWVGLGAPKQEQWMADHEGKVHGIMLGVGAAFDFHAGTVKRAPGWVQELCLEWFYRMMQDPGRLIKRYVSTNLSFMLHTAAEGHRVKKQIRLEHPRVAQIGHKRIPSREGGVEIVVAHLSTGLVDRGWRVDAYNRSGYHVSGKEFDTRHNKYYHGVRIITIPTFQNGKLNAIVYTFLATIRALFGNYDVYHYHAEGPCVMLGLLHLFRKKIIVTIHGLDWQRSKWGGFATRVLKAGEKSAAKYADEIIVLSASMQQYFLDTYGRQTHFIPNGISRPVPVEAQEIREKWGLEAGKYILFMARIVPEKGLHYLIEAFKKIDTDMKLVIAGGSSHTDDYCDMIHKLASGDDRIVFTNFVQGRHLEELYSNARIFVLPSDIEGMAIGLLEAMSYGLACVVSDIPENTEVVSMKPQRDDDTSDEQYAVIFKHGDSEDLKEKLEMLLANPDKIDYYADRAADYICSRYSWEAVVDGAEKLYRK